MERLFVLIFFLRFGNKINLHTRLDVVVVNGK